MRQRQQVEHPSPWPVVGGLFAVCGVLMAATVWWTLGEMQKPRTRPSIPDVQPIADRSPRTGDTVRIGAPPFDPDAIVTIAPTDDGWDEKVKATMAGDVDELASLVIDGTLFGVAEGTKARILEHSGTAFRVRILEGPQDNKKGWVEQELCTPID
jgi:hypothetical protein